jgi:CRISPR-associated endonuclease/helicase Cas3
MENELLAHVRQDENGEWQVHRLQDHLEGTAKLVEEFAAVFGLNTLADVVGKVHDYGKASNAFQTKIDPELHVNPHVDHSTAGAQFLVQQYGRIAILLAYVIAGHHAGLPNGRGESESVLSKRLKKSVEEYLNRVHYQFNFDRLSLPPAPAPIPDRAG